MKKYIGTVSTVCIVLFFIVLSIVWRGNPFTNDQMSTFKLPLIVCGCSIAYCFIAGEITHNYSQMDKLWSLLPIAYSWIIAVRGGMSARLIVFALIVTTRGVRLTINLYIHGQISDVSGLHKTGAQICSAKKI